MKRGMVLVTISLLLLSVTFVVAQSSDLVSYYPFGDEEQRDDVTGRNAQNFGANFNVAGTSGDGVYFDGQNDFIRVDNFNKFSGQSWSLSFWIQPGFDYDDKDADDVNPVMIYWGTATPTNQVYFYEHGDSDSLAISMVTGGKNYAAYKKYPFDENDWVHVAATYSSSTKVLSLYLDGELADTETGIAPVQGIGSMHLGNSPWGNQYDGGMDELRIYNRVLSANDVRALAGLAPETTLTCQDVDFSCQGLVSSADQQILANSLLHLLSNEVTLTTDVMEEIIDDQKLGRNCPTYRSFMEEMRDTYQDIPLSTYTEYSAKVNECLTDIGPQNEPPCGTLGDVDGNGFITQQDYLLVGQIIASPTSYSELERKNADINGDGKLSATDWTELGRFVNGEISKFSGCGSGKNPSPTVGRELACGQWGDVNDDGLISSVDADMIADHVNGISLPKSTVNYADVSGDSQITAGDAGLVLRYVEGIINTFPACANTDLCQDYDFDCNGVVNDADKEVISEFYASLFELGHEDGSFDEELQEDLLRDQKLQSCSPINAYLDNARAQGGLGFETHLNPVLSQITACSAQDQLYVCTDSDQGISYFERGIMEISSDSVHGSADGEDFCVSDYPAEVVQELVSAGILSQSQVDANVLFEFYCSENPRLQLETMLGSGIGVFTVASITECQYGCSEGACLPPPENNGRVVCKATGSTVEVGPRTRAEVNGDVQYCDPLTLKYAKVKNEGVACLNDFECNSNACIDGQCVSLRLEIEEQTNILNRLWCFLTSGFSSESEAYTQCLADAAGN